MIRSASLSRQAMFPAMIALAACALAGVTMSVRAPLTPFVALAAGVGIVSLQWRTGVILMLVLLPFSGVPVFIAGASGLAVRDLLIVMPLYAGFALEMTRRREPVLPALGIAIPALAAFAVLVLAYLPMAPTLASGAIAVRVWLAYIPMIAVGYTFVRRIEDAEKLLKLTALLGLIPASIAIAECLYASQTGGFGPFERLYGGSHLEDVSRFVVFTTGGSSYIRIPRVASTFTSVSQYYGFALVAFAAGLSMALRRRNVAWTLCAGFLGAAALASGARAAYVMVPAIAAISIMFDDPRPRLAALAVPCAIVFGGFVALGADPIAIAHQLPSHMQVTRDTAWSEMSGSLRFIGHGTGWDTNAALRYGGVADRRYVENWYAKSALELGVAGLITIVIALVAIASTLLRSLRSAPRPARQLTTPVVALLLGTTVALFKGPYIDLDPMNVYFWLLIGVIAGVFRASSVPAASLEAEVT